VTDMMAVPDLGTVLGVWAHPDDEAYLSAGLMGAARDAGQRVVVATATMGELGGSGPIAELRRREAAASLAVVGVAEHRWLGFVDGGCADLDPAVGAAAVGTLLEEVRPDTVVTFGPEGMTGHPDHVAIGEWVARAWRADGCRARLLQATLTQSFHRTWGELCARHGIWMPGARPPAVADTAVDLRIRLDGVRRDRKFAALAVHASQTAGLREAVGDETYGRWWAEECFVLAPEPAEEAA
jgi:LmbE family N-acetylglucosaminyl deacetylase